MNWFVKTLSRVVTEDIGEEANVAVEATNFFVDFLRLGLGVDNRACVAVVAH